MLQIVVPKTELYDERKNEFIIVDQTVLKLEHSLISISKWESKWCKHFLLNDGEEPHTAYEILDYIKCMTMNDVPENVYTALTPENVSQINKYINNPMTATTINDRRTVSHSREIITSELIYYWMVAYNIPFSCEKWHINRLLMLIRVCEAKNNTKKMSRKEIAEQNRSINAARRKALRSKG